MVEFDKNVTKIIADKLDYYANYADIEEIPIDILRIMYEGGISYER